MARAAVDRQRSYVKEGYDVKAKAIVLGKGVWRSLWDPDYTMD
jgi:hypothetical protein